MGISLQLSPALLRAPASFGLVMLSRASQTVAARKVLLLASLGAVFFVVGTGGRDERASGTDSPVRTDRFGAPLPKDALVRVGVTRFCVEGSVSSVGFSPDGKWLAGGDSYGSVYLWEAATGKMIRQLDAGERSPVVFFSRDGKTLGTRAAQGEVRLWETDSGKLHTSIQRERRGNEYYQEQLLLSPDRTRLIVVSDANSMIAVRNGKHADAYVIGKLPELSIDLLKLPGGKLVKHLARSAPETVFSDAALSPDGKLLAVGIRAYKAPRKLLRVIDAASGEVVREVTGEGDGWYLSVAFSHDGGTLALGSKDEISLVDVATGKLVHRLTAKMSTVGFLGFGPHAKTLVSHSHDNKVRLWDLASGNVVRLFAAEATDHFTFPLPTGRREPPAHDEFFGKANGTALSPDGKTVVVGASCCAQLWDVVAGKQLFPDQTLADGWNQVAFSPNGRLLLVGSWKHSCLWDSVTGEVHKELPTATAFGIFSPDGKQLAFARHPAEKDKESPAAVIWDIAEAKELHRLEHPPKNQFWLTKLAFAPDGRTLVTLSSHQENAGYRDAVMVHRWDTRTGKLLGTIHRQDTHAWPSAIGPDGRIAAITLGSGLMLTDVVNDEDIWSREDRTPEKWSGSYPAFSPDGGFLVAWSKDGHVGMWEIATRSVIARLCLHRDGNVKLAKWPDPGPKGELQMTVSQAEIEALAVSPDGRFVAASEQFTNAPYRALSPKPLPWPVICIWEAATGKEVQRLEGFRSVPLSLSFSPDSHRLASSFRNDTVLIWDVSQATRPGAKRLTPDLMEKFWGDLALADGAKAYSAMIAFQEAPGEAVDFLARHVRPVPVASANRVQQLIKNLDSDRFTEREASAKELKTLAVQFRIILRNALNGPASPEVKRRLEAILAETPRQLPIESLRTVRSIQTLERIGSAEARRALGVLADGTPEAHETLAAQTALQRLTMRSKNAQ